MLERRCKTGSKYMDESTSSDGNDEPFKPSDDEKDRDYQQPLKKPRYDHKRKAPLTKKISSDRAQAHSSKPLTAAQRIMRLKMKTMSNNNNKNAMTSENEINNPTTSQQTVNVCQSQTVKFENHDHLFDVSSNASSERTHGQQTVENFERENRFFQSENNFDEHQVTSDCCQKTSESILLMNHQIIDLTNAVNLMRKQLARIEMKSMEFSRATSSGVIDGEVLLDFETTLANESLPLRTCVEINNFELRLRNDPGYRNKMVKCLILIFLCDESCFQIREFSPISNIAYI